MSILVNEVLRIYNLMYWMVFAVFFINYGILFCLTDILGIFRLYSIILGLFITSSGLNFYKVILNQLKKNNITYSKTRVSSVSRWMKICIWRKIS